MNLRHPLAGGIEQGGVNAMQPLALMGRDTVGPNDHLLAPTFLQLVLLADSFFFEHGQHLPIVDEGAESTDLFTLLALLDRLQGHLQRILYPFTETRRFGHKDSHRLLILILQAMLSVIPCSGLVMVCSRRSPGTDWESSRFEQP